MKDWTRADTPRTWEFWVLWAGLRITAGTLFYALGWMPAFWFLLGSLLPDAAWYSKDERLKATCRSIEPLLQTVAQLDAENKALRGVGENYRAVERKFARLSGWSGQPWH